MDYLTDAQPKKQDAKHAAAVGMIYEMQRAAIVDIRPCTCSKAVLICM